MLISRVHSMSIREVRNGRDTDHLADCSCGWLSLPYPNRFDAVMEKCPVMEAELEGAQRRAKYRALAQSA